MVDTKIRAAPYKFCSFELSSIICQNPPGYTESVYNALQELVRCFLCDIHHWHCLHLLGECVDRDE
jgi:hypothetical protein